MKRAPTADELEAALVKVFQTFHDHSYRSHSPPGYPNTRIVGMDAYKEALDTMVDTLGPDHPALRYYRTK